MFTLRRAVARSIFVQPTRQVSVSRTSLISPLRAEQPVSIRSFHQSLRWRADGEQNKTSPAEAASSNETVTTEPGAEELKEIKEESIATSDVAETAQETAQRVQETAQETAQTVQENLQENLSQAAQEAAQTGGEKVQEFAHKAQDAVSGVAQSARDAFSNRSQGQAPRDRTQDGDRKPSRILYVGNIFFEVTTAQLEAEFAKFGTIANSKIVLDGRGNSKGFGYIEFADQQSADRAVRELNQKVVQGRRIAVQYHVRRDQRPGRDNAQSRDPNPPSKTLFIGNMSYQMSDKDLNDLFREINNVLDVRVAIDRRTGQPRGFAHADFVDVDSAKKAKKLLENKEIYGRQLRVDYSAAGARDRTT